MKNSIWLGAMTAMMLFATSCQSDKYSEEMEGKTSVVSFTLEQPGITSRGYSDGNGPKTLIYAVYDENGEPVIPAGENNSGYKNEEKYGTTEIIDQKANVSIEFGTDQLDKTYTFVFWAAHQDAVFYVFDSEKGTITDTSAEIKGNDETRDAFFASKTLTVTSAGAENLITLRRPFAQLNIGLLGNFVTYQPKACEVTVTGDISKSFDLRTGEVAAKDPNAEPETVTYKMATFPENESFPIDAGNIKYLSMNYLLVPADKQTVDVTYTLSEDMTADANDKGGSISSVPVQRNYRTNIIIESSFAPKNTAVFVTDIDESYEKEVLANGGALINGTYYENLADALAVATDGAVITLGAGKYEIPAGATGKTLTFVGTGNPKDTEINLRANGNTLADNALANSTVTFENLTLNAATVKDVKLGFGHCNATYRNCIINGEYTLYHKDEDGISTFEDCTFNVKGEMYNVWTYGVDVTFTNCTFNCDGKSVLIYHDDVVDDEVSFTNCTFNDEDGLVDETKAAIEAATNLADTKHAIHINKCTVKGFNNTEVKSSPNHGGTNSGTNVWGNKNMMKAENLNVFINGEEVY